MCSVSVVSDCCPSSSHKRERESSSVMSVNVNVNASENAKTLVMKRETHLKMMSGMGF